MSFTNRGVGPVHFHAAGLRRGAPRVRCPMHPEEDAFSPSNALLTQWRVDNLGVCGTTHLPRGPHGGGFAEGNVAVSRSHKGVPSLEDKGAQNIHSLRG